MAVNEVKYERVFNQSLDLLSDIFKRKSEQVLSNDELVKFKIATSVLASWPRYRQAITSTAEVALAVLKGASETEAQYREFVREHMPRLSPIKLLPQFLEDNKLTNIELQRQVSSLEHGRDDRLAMANSEILRLKEENASLGFELRKHEH